MHLAGLFIYPVKSLGGFAVTEAAVDALGLAGDRRFLVVDAEGKFLTQRAIPRMALIAARLAPETLNLSSAGAGSVAVRRESPGDGAAATRKVTVWQSEGLTAEDCGEEAADWLGHFLGLSCRLVRIGPGYSRAIQPHKVPATLRADSGGVGTLAPPQVSFADGFPMMVVGEASLAHLNDRLAERGEEPVPMNRFRPNLVVAGGEAFEEDTWRRIRIGAVTFHAGGPCARCIMTCTDQTTAERGVEPLRTLADYRRDAARPERINFGENLINETKAGRLRVGDPVEVLP